VNATARVVAHPNIALAKYWGKTGDGENLPAVPSLSLTLDAMSTTTSVTFQPELEADRVVINGNAATPDEARRITELLDRVRRAVGVRAYASVETTNDFPTASGLASSASGFAALALAATKAAGLDWDAAKVSDLARRSSVSAARSVYGGFVTLAAGTPGGEFLAAEPLADASDWPIAMCVAVTTLAKKEVGSTDGMAHTRRASPYYAAWVAKAPELFERARRAVLSRDLEALGTCAEESAFAMHATALAAAPALIYFSPATLAAVLCVQKLRREGTLAFVTIDAGPHVKVLSYAADAPRVRAALREVEGVRDVVVARPGPAASSVGAPEPPPKGRDFA
jgi:diphosphomevalonate decarboxylase